LVEEPLSVVVTGIGMVSPLGLDAPSSLEGLFAGRSGIGQRTLFELAGARSTLAAEVRGLVAEADESRTDAMALRAAREALADAGLEPGASGLGLIVGGTTAGMFETEELLVGLAGQAGSASLGDETMARLRTHPLSATVDRLVERLGPFELTATVCCACSSGAVAAVLAAAWIEAGRVDRVLVGGSDALCRLTYAGFGALAVLSPEPCRPFDRRRSGLTLGEAAAFLVLERRESAATRGRKPRATLLGRAMAGEAHHITNPQPEGRTAARILADAVRSAGLGPRDVAYVNAHGTATPLNDGAEASAIRAAFGDAPVVVSSSKGQIGHTLGAAGAIEAVISVAAIERGLLPPTVGLEEPDRGVTIDLVRETRRVAPGFVALTCSFGFGGTGAALVLGPAGARSPPRARPAELVITGLGIVARGRLLGSREAPSLFDDLVDEIAVDPSAELDAGRARRFDRAARLVATAVGAALVDADCSATSPLDRTRTAAIAGNAFGNVDGSMRFMRRVLEKGAALASPADFPNLVPSSPVSHAAIYHGLEGPALCTPDLSTSAESAFASALALVGSGDVEAAVAGSVEEKSELVERVLAPVLGVRSLAATDEGGACLVVETAAGAAARGARVVACVLEHRSSSSERAVDGLRGPADGGVVVAERHVDLDAALAGTPWAMRPRRVVGRSAGEHVALGGVALALGAALAHTGEYERVLVVGVAPGRSHAFVLGRPRAC
jgi:3-oxoacyl-[acyl-carrier-protein] synthase II